MFTLPEFDQVYLTDRDLQIFILVFLMGQTDARALARVLGMWPHANSARSDRVKKDEIPGLLEGLKRVGLLRTADYSQVSVARLSIASQRALFALPQTQLGKAAVEQALRTTTDIYRFGCLCLPSGRPPKPYYLVHEALLANNVPQAEDLRSGRFAQASDRDWCAFCRQLAEPILREPDAVAPAVVFHLFESLAEEALKEGLPAGPLTAVLTAHVAKLDNLALSPHKFLTLCAWATWTASRDLLHVLSAKAGNPLHTEALAKIVGVKGEFDAESVSARTVTGGVHLHLRAQFVGEVALDNGKVLAFTELLAKIGDRTGAFVRLNDRQYLRLTQALVRQMELLVRAGEEDLLASREWNIAVLDEAQAVKNHLAKRTKIVKRFRSHARVIATGTPVENNLTELWSLFDFLNPGLLGSTHGQFERRFCNADGTVGPLLKRMTAPFILRRLKSAVLDDLPPKTEITLTVTLDDDERALYESCRREALAALEGADGENNRIAILAHLTKLRRACCHPSLVMPGCAMPGQKVEALLELVQDLRANGHRALVFSQFVDFLSIIRKRLDAAGITCQYLDGSTPVGERADAVSRFQRGEGDLFLISLKAGGTGLNLTAANYVVLLDPWWNPAVETQAADRAHRIGQRNPVTVYRLVTTDTVEERVVALHAKKLALAESILDDTADTRLNASDLISLFKA